MRFYCPWQRGHARPNLADVYNTFSVTDEEADGQTNTQIDGKKVCAGRSGLKVDAK